MVKRIYTEKKNGFDTAARLLEKELADFLGPEYAELGELNGLRLIKRYDVEGLDEGQFTLAVAGTLSEPWGDMVFREVPAGNDEKYFGIEYLPGQYDWRSDLAEQRIELATGIRPKVSIADILIFKKPISEASLKGIKKYLINPVISREASGEIPFSIKGEETTPTGIPILSGFVHMNSAELEGLAGRCGLGMSKEDLLLCQNWFAKEGRDPPLTELKVLDTYWSDHCRHTTFNTIFEKIEIAGDHDPLKKAFQLYEETRKEVYGTEPKERSLMDIATLGTKALKKKGLVTDLDESPEVNACTIKINAEYSDGSSEPWLLLFKNETHNHPTEIEPFGGAATCLGGGIRDPLSGRAIVHQAMRITGGGDPRAAIRETLPGKLPQRKIAREAAAGYSSYGNQVGVAAGQVAEFYHPGFLAKRMELGALIGAVPEAWVCREEPTPGDVVILVGGKTGRDGIGGATGSSKAQSGEPTGEPTGEAADEPSGRCPAGNAAEERKIMRLFRKAEVCRFIKRCNDFGAGGVSVAVCELAAGLDINLDAVPAKEPGLDGTELALSESQERMAVVCAAADAGAFINAAAEENLEAVVIAKVTAGDQITESNLVIGGDQVTSDSDARVRMVWRGKTIVDLSRELLDSNGAPRYAKALLKAEIGKAKNSDSENQTADSLSELPAGVLLDKLERELAGLRSGSRRGLGECFDGSIGAASVLFPWGGNEQGTPECGMAALLPSAPLPSPHKTTRTASLMTFGYDPVLLSLDPYTGAKGSVREALVKYACLGGDPFGARLSLQEYFERPEDPETWGRPAAALLGALEAQLRLGVPAIGGKDSMSGNFRGGDLNLAVPPTLVAFAAGTVPVGKVRSGTLSGKGGNAIVLLSQSALNEYGRENFDEWETFKANMKTLEALAASGALRAAYPVGPGGIASTLAVMAFGNMTGVEAYADSFSMVNPLDYQGSVLAEVDEAALPAGLAHSWTLAARTLDEPVFRIVWPVPATALGEDENPEALAAETSLEVLRRAYEYPLSRVYPQTSTGATVAEPTMGSREQGEGKKEKGEESSEWGVGSGEWGVARTPSPLAVLPVFPGTNGEWDMERAFREAGAKTQIVVFRNRNKEDIDRSLAELALAFKEAAIIAFSSGDSGFIAGVIRSGPITEAINRFLDHGGLVLGISDGFGALLETGLLPYGRIIPPTEDSPTETMPALAPNPVGRHVSRMVRTRTMKNISPWLNLEKEGTIHVVPASSSQGRLTIRPEEAEALFAVGQIPFCYVDAKGNPTMTEPDNPFASAFAIEGLVSPDGRILGKMAHSERCGEYVHINIPGNKHQRIFEAGVKFFRG